MYKKCKSACLWKECFSKYICTKQYKFSELLITMRYCLLGAGETVSGSAVSAEGENPARFTKEDDVLQLI